MRLFHEKIFSPFENFMNPYGFEPKFQIQRFQVSRSEMQVPKFWEEHINIGFQRINPSDIKVTFDDVKKNLKFESKSETHEDENGIKLYFKTDWFRQFSIPENLDESTLNVKCYKNNIKITGKYIEKQADDKIN